MSQHSYAEQINIVIFGINWNNTLFIIIVAQLKLAEIFNILSCRKAVDSEHDC